MHFNYNTTEVPVEIDDRNLVGRPTLKVECGSASRHQAKRRCRLCDPVSGQCRRLCVRNPARKID